MTMLPLDDERTLTIAQFCEAEGLTLDQYRVLHEIGKGPIEIILGGSATRITPPSRREWHRRIIETERFLSGYDFSDEGQVITRCDSPLKYRIVLIRDENGFVKGTKVVARALAKSNNKLSTEGTA